MYKSWQHVSGPRNPSLIKAVTSLPHILKEEVSVRGERIFIRKGWEGVEKTMCVVDVPCKRKVRRNAGNERDSKDDDTERGCVRTAPWGCVNELHQYVQCDGE